tara:strand:+ start:205 stop:456 length:252 start_codon:yes stop_codon:yes gene_type:complete
MFIKDNQLPGLYQRERSSGNVWVVKAKQRGLNKPVTVTIGRTDVIPVREARRIAKEKLSKLAEGQEQATRCFDSDFQDCKLIK